MDIRFYTKSGNEHYFDASMYDKEQILSSLVDGMSRKNVLTLDSQDGTFTINFGEVEAFEIIEDEEEAQAGPFLFGMDMGI